MNRLLRLWSALDPKQKRLAAIVGVIAGVLTVAAIGTTFTQGERVSLHPKSKPTIENVLTDSDPRQAGFDAMASNITMQQQKLDTALREIKKLGEKQVLNETSAKEIQTLKEEISALTAQLEQSAKQQAEKQEKPANSSESSKTAATQTPDAIMGGGATPMGDSNGLSTAEGYFAAAANPAEQGEPKGGAVRDKKIKARSIVEEIQADAKAKKNSDSVTYLPTGSLIGAVLITGMAAPTGQQARREPFPALLRVKEEAILPNRFRADIKDCSLVVSGFGDLSSERAYLRAEAISCVRTDGGVIEAKLDAFAVGEDGKAGVRGRLVSRQGQYLARSMAADFLQGVSQAFSLKQVPSITVRNANDNNSVQAPVFEQAFNSQVLQGAAISGAGKAVDRVAEFYLEMAEGMFPVIEIDAARRIDFVMTRGAALKFVGAPASVVSEDDLSQGDVPDA